MESGFAVFDFGKVDMVVFGADDVDFVKIGFVVLFDDGVSVLFEICGNELLGLFANRSGVFARLLFWREAGERFAGFEGFAVFFCQAVLIDSGDVRFGTVADVFIEPIFWVVGSEVYHIVVTSNFSDDGGGGDFADFNIGFDEGGGVVCKWGVV